VTYRDLKAKTDRAVKAEWDRLLGEQPKASDERHDLLVLLLFAVGANLEPVLRAAARPKRGEEALPPQDRTVTLPRLLVEPRPFAVLPEEAGRPVVVETLPEPETIDLSVGEAIPKVIRSAFVEWGPEITLVQIQEEYVRNVSGLLDGVRLGKLTPELAREQFGSFAQAAFTKAFAYGGGVAPNAEQMTALMGRVTEESAFFEGLLEDAQKPGYSDARVEQRMGMYGRRLWSEYTRGRINRLAADVTVHWVLDPRASHCHDCPRLASEGPYTPATLPAIPGDGSTECLTNCRCRIVTRRERKRIPWGKSVGLALPGVWELTKREGQPVEWVRKQQPGEQGHWVTTQGGKRIFIAQGGAGKQGQQQPTPQAAPQPPADQPESDGESPAKDESERTRGL